YLPQRKFFIQHRIREVGLARMVRRRGYRLYNINNLKLARFKEIFPGAANSVRIDARKGLAGQPGCRVGPVQRTDSARKIRKKGAV
ncbi:MAG: hypothetical protein WD688_07615, partial [Candidatus Binatia bacterium]